ncbi:polyprotein [Cucumis melo var. makuwa]|uniref:Polyprotein n=1 Tax=Cucumis melo var. makuwa TaxID=1194695 RepID=A0A5A7V5T4_CUCMM|nr:polyprotein [Cucumis melo var. makuwa]
MLYLAEVPDSVHFLESRLEEIAEKTDMIDVVVGRVEGLPIQELLARVDTLEENGRTTNYEYGNSSSGFVAHMKKRVNELVSFQKTLLEMINGMSEDFRATLDVIINESQIVKITKPKPFCGARNAKTLENYIFDLEQYFRAMNTVTEKAKLTLATMHLSEDAKLWWRSRYVDMQEGHCTIDTSDTLKKEQRSQFFPEKC